MANTPTERVIDYTSLDYQSVRADLIRFVREECGVNLTDLNPSDLAIVLVESLAYSTDLLAFNLHRLVRECVPTQARRLTNFQNAAKTFSFYVGQREQSQAQVVLNLDVSGGAVSVSKHDKYATKSGVVFQPVADSSHVASPVTIDVIEGDEIQGEVLSNSSPGTPLQSYVLSGSPVIESTVEIYVGGIPWTVSRTTALALASDKVFTLQIDQSGICTVRFGDGINGRIPTVGAVITASYKRGGGSDGNVEEAIDQITYTVAPIAKFLGILSSTKATGGYDPQSLINAQASLPGFVRSNDRCVETSDYAAETVNVPGISKAVAVEGQYGSGGCGTPVVVYAAPNGGILSSLTPTLVAAIKNHLNQRKMVGEKIVVRPPIYASLVVDLEVWVLPGYFAADVATLVQNTVLDRFDFDSMDFGFSFGMQELYDLLSPSSIPGVQKISVNKFGIKPVMGKYELFPTTGNGSLVYTDQTQSAYEKWLRVEYKMVCTSAGGSSGAAEFSVRPRFLGVASQVSDSQVQDDTASWLPGAFVGYNLIVNPYSLSPRTYPITGNTISTLTVSGTGLLDYLEPEDEFVIESPSASTQVCYGSTTTAPVVSSTTIPLVDPSGFSTLEPVVLQDSSGNVYLRGVVAVNASDIEVSAPVASLANGATVDVYHTYGGELTLAIRQGTRRWVAGDAFYVDRFPIYGDIALRPIQYPHLDSVDLAIRTIGGRT